MTAKVKMMITKAEKKRLREMGHSDADIYKMTPDQADAILNPTPVADAQEVATMPAPSQLPDEFEALVADAQEVATRPTTQAIEATILSGLFTTTDAVARILEDARPGDFHFAANRGFAAVVWPALTAGQHVDRVTFEEALTHFDDRDWRSLGLKTDDRDAVLKVADVVFADDADRPALGKVDAYLKIFADDAKKRLTKNLIEKVAEAFDRGDLSATDAFAKAQATIFDLETSRRLVGAYKSEADDWPAYWAALEAKQIKADYIGLNTGFDHLNNVANGLTEGLIIVGAKPSQGKTTFAKQLIDNVVELNPTAAGLFISLEQSREELRVKTLSRLSTIENRDILRGRLDPTSEGWQKVKAAGDEFLTKVAGRLFILEGDKATTPDRIRLAALQVKRATGADVVFVVIDYLQIVPTAEEYRDPRNRVDAVVSELRRIARDLHIPILAVSSLGRSGYDRASISSFKESGGIEYGADIGALLIRKKDDQKGKTPVNGVDRKWERLRLNVVKNRNGEKARIDFDFYPEISEFVEINKSELIESDEEDVGD